MSLFHPGDTQHWKRTPLDHLVRPLRMRPDHPLPDLPAAVKPSDSKRDEKEKKKKEKPVDPSTQILKRARPTVIDPTRYGAVHLTASSGMLGAEVMGYDKVPEASKDTSSTTTLEDSTSESDASGDEEESSADESESDSDGAMPQDEAPPAQSVKTNFKLSAVKPETEPTEDDDTQIQNQRKRDLDILGSLLDGKETVALELDSDLEELAKAQKDLESSSSSEETSSDSDSESESEVQSSKEGSDEDEDAGAAADEAIQQQAGAVQTTSLKAMFAPKPDEGKASPAP